MRAWFSYLWWILVPGLALAQADTADVSGTMIEALKGGWSVGYLDRDRGWIHGRGFLDPEFGTGSVTLKNPNTGTTETLSVSGFSVSGQNVKITLSPGGPRSGVGVPPAGDAISVATNQVQLRLGDQEISATIGRIAEPPGTVHLSLVYDPETKKLSGDWTMQVNAIDGLAGDHPARAGIYLFGAPDEGGATMMGREVWKRPNPQILGAFSVLNQFEGGADGLGLSYPYPDGRQDPIDSHAALRHVMVVGHDLPLQYGESMIIESGDPSITYAAYSLESDYASSRPDTNFRDKGFESIAKMQETSDPPYRWTPEEGDFLILQAHLKSGVSPGRKHFKINGTPAVWLLRFGDHRGTLGLARDDTQDLRGRADLRVDDIPIYTDFAAVAYASEEVYVEFRTMANLPMDRLTAMIAKNGRFLKFGGKREIPLERSKISASRGWVYRSAPILLQPSGAIPPNVLQIPVKFGDVLQVHVGGDPVLAVTPYHQPIRVIDEPADIRRAIRPGLGLQGMTWRDALKMAAECAKLSELEMLVFHRVGGQTADTITNIVPTNLLEDAPAILKTRIKIGDHAASILLRQMVIDMMAETLPGLESVKSNDEILALRRLLKDAVRYGDHPFEKVTVANPKGRPDTLELSFFPGILENTYGMGRRARRTYQIWAMREARKKMAVAVREGVAKAMSIKVCDVEEMIKLTGFSFETVEERLFDALMIKKDPARGSTMWVPDRRARTYVRNLNSVARSLIRQQALSSTEWSKINLSLSVATLFAGFSSHAAVLGTAFLIDASNLGITINNEWVAQTSGPRELAFARGATAIIGTARVNRATRQARSGILTGFAVGMAVIPTVFSGYAAYTAGVFNPVTKLGHRVIRGLSSQLKSTGYAALRRLPRAEAEAALVATVRAQDLETAIGRAAMETQELEALDFGRLIQSGEIPSTATAAAANPPDWARGLSPGAFSRLDDMVVRADVIQMVRSNPGGMERLILDDDALSILRIPHQNFAAFEEAVRVFKARAPTRGREFVRQAHPLAGNPEGLTFSKPHLFREGEILMSSMSVYHGVTSGGQPIRSGYFQRGRMPDPVFGSGKDMFVFDTAQTFRTAIHGPRLDVPQPYAAGPRWVLDVNVPLRSDAPGVPTVMYANLRSAQSLGFRFGDAKFGGITLRNVLSANTAAEFHWLRATYPEKSLHDLFRHTTSFRYAQNTANQLGFRLTDIHVETIRGPDGRPFTDSFDNLVAGRWFDPGNVSTPEQLAAARAVFSEKYRIPGNTEIEVSFNVHMRAVRGN